MATLYQKYRPNNFEEIVNQNHIKITLQNEIETGQIAHAYLFSGPRGTGKTTMARVLAKSLNCDKREPGTSEPCGECDSCGQIKKGTSLDIIEIDAASHTGVDNVRENIIASSRISIKSGKYRIFIIDEVHMLSISAFNSLLKTLEEPPEKVIFILATTEVQKLPTTIISRCQRFDFKRISVNDISQKLKYICSKEGIKYKEDILETIARQSEGHMRDAESLLSQVISISGKEITTEKAELVIPRSNLDYVIELISLIINKNSPRAIRLVNKIVDEGIDLRQFSEDAIENLRRILLAKISPDLAEKFAQGLGQDLEEKINPVIKQAQISQLVEIISLLSEAKRKTQDSFITQMPLEIAIIRLCSLALPYSQNQNSQNQTASLPTANSQNASGGDVKNYNKNNSSQAQPVANAKPVNLEEIKSKWSELLLAVKKYNHSLSFILKVCELREQNGILCLVFKYKFHQDRVEQMNIKQLVSQAFKNVYGSAVSFTTLLDENLTIPVENVNNNKIIEPSAHSNQNAEQYQKAEQRHLEVGAETEDNQEVEDKKYNKKDDNNKESVDSILKMFGGKIIQ